MTGEPTSVHNQTMDMNRPRYTNLDEAIAAEVRAEFGRQSLTKNIADLAKALDMRRATLSSRVNGHMAFTAGQLKAVADYLETTPQDLTAEAIRQMRRANTNEGVAA